MLDEKETAVFLEKLSGSILHVKDLFDERCKIYDEHVRDGVAVRDRLTSVEGKAKALEDLMWKVVLSGVLLPIIVSVVMVFIMEGIKR